MSRQYSSAAECRILRKPRLEPPFAAVLKLGHFRYFHDAPVHSVVEICELRIYVMFSANNKSPSSRRLLELILRRSNVTDSPQRNTPLNAVVMEGASVNSVVRSISCCN